MAFRNTLSQDLGHLAWLSLPSGARQHLTDGLSGMPIAHEHVLGDLYRTNLRKPGGKSCSAGQPPWLMRSLGLQYIGELPIMRGTRTILGVPSFWETSM